MNFESFPQGNEGDESLENKKQNRPRREKKPADEAESSEQSEQPTQPEKQERLRDRVTSPQADAIIEIFQKHFEKNETANGSKTETETEAERMRAETRIETVRDVLYTFFEQAIENTQIYSSEKCKASFPYTKIDIAELAKSVYSHYATLPETARSEQTNTPSAKNLKNPENKENGENKEGSEKKHQEFIFGSFITPQNGHQFTFFEEAMHQYVKKLPAIIESIKNGGEPADNEIFVLGSPTNELGSMSPEFLESMKNGNTFKQFGALYADFIEAQLPKGETERENTGLYLYGISMGGSFATQTAEQLIAAGKITQSHEEAEEKHIPFAQIRVDTLPGASTSKIKKWQIPLGFAVDGAFTMATNAYTRTSVLKEGKASKAIQEVLAERGIVPNTTPEQDALKKRAIYGKESLLKGIVDGKEGVLNELRKGIPIDPNLVITEVRGIYDPLQYSGEFKKEVKKQRKEHAGSLGENTVSKSENHRVVGINQAHTLVFFRDNEFRRLNKAAQELEKLKK